MNTEMCDSVTRYMSFMKNHKHHFIKNPNIITEEEKRDVMRVMMLNIEKLFSQQNLFNKCSVCFNYYETLGTCYDCNVNSKLSR